MTPSALPTLTYRARWVLPIDQPTIADGAVTVQAGVIVRVGRHQGEPAIDLGPVVVTPGLVNAHVHLDLESLPPAALPSSAFPDWLRQVVQQRRLTDDPVPIIRSNLAEAVASGVTLIGDIAGSSHSLPLLRAAPIHAVVFRELIGLRPDRFEPIMLTVDAELAAGRDDRVCLGVSPHAPYSTATPAYRRWQHHPNLLKATHWFESMEEIEFLRTGQGPMRDFLDTLGALPAPTWKPTDRPWQDLLVGRNWILAHANYLTPTDEEELVRLHQAGVVRGVVFCPRTHQRFGHPAHPWPRLRQRGVTIGLGTDSRASNPDLSLFAEAQFLARSHDPELVWRLATLEGARLLGHADQTGSITVSKRADLAVVEVSEESAGNPYAAALHPQAKIRPLIDAQDKVF